MTQQFRYVGGHIEVFTENGEFLFSADTMHAAIIIFFIITHFK